VTDSQPTDNASPVTSVFDSYQAARDAIRALEAAGVEADAISVVTRSPREAETLEYDTGASEDLEDATVHRSRLSRFVDWLGRVESVAVPGFGAVLGTGDLWQDVQLAGSGHGAVTGALVGCGVPVDEADRLEQAVFSGRILLVIHGSFDRASVSQILNRS
jgi:hypothetical protein